jgi:acyl carrier protein
VMKPKVDGAWNLHELTMHLPLEFFVLFSSGAGLFGNPGQSSYAAANVFLDELAAARFTNGLPALSVNWGPWGEVGMAATLHQRHVEGWDSQGLSSISPTEGLTILEMTMRQSQTAQVAALPIEEAAWKQSSAGRPIPPLTRSLVAAASQTAGESDDLAKVDNGDAARRFNDAQPEQKRDVLIEIIGEIVREVFGINTQRRVPTDQNLTTLGMDSLLAIQLSNRLKTSFSAAVPPTLTFQYPTIEAIADYLLETLASGVETRPQPELVSIAIDAGQPLDSRKAQSILANLDQLSDQDVEALLNEIETKRN